MNRTGFILQDRWPFLEEQATDQKGRLVCWSYAAATLFKDQMGITLGRRWRGEGLRVKGGNLHIKGRD